MFNFLSIFGEEQEGNVNISWGLALISADTYVCLGLYTAIQRS